MIIGVDFDGTIALHEFPNIGLEIPGAIHWMKEWQKAGADLMLWTVRTDGPEYGDVQTQAVEWCRKRGVEFVGVNETVCDASWTLGPKIFAHLIVDDCCFGCPLKHGYSGRPYVDWDIVGPAVLESVKAMCA